MMRAIQRTSSTASVRSACARIERAQLDRLGGAALELLRHHLAVARLDHDAVAAPDRRGRRDHDHGAVAIEPAASRRRRPRAHRHARRSPPETRSRPSPCRPESRRRRNSRRRRPAASAISGTAWVAAPPRSVISDTKLSSVTPVACSDFAIDSVEGQRGRPSGVMRFDLLKVVGSSPAFLASPEAERPARAASRSTAFQMSAWVSIARCATAILRVEGENRRLCRNKNSTCPCAAARRLKRVAMRADSVPRARTRCLATTIYKISPRALWREAERAGRVHRRAGRPRRRLHPFLDRRAGRRDRGAAFRRRRAIWCWSRSTPRRSAPRCATSPRAAARCSRISTARCRSRRCAG